ncbi:MAG TPA: asparagine synthase-related protein [Burkholderiales bacterium]|nr:asparagine synthase-related protein [Burkholderiales bacterium]
MPLQAHDDATASAAELAHPGWAIAGSTHAIGQAHAPDGRLLRAREIAQRLDAVADPSGWVQSVASLNGSFAVVGWHADGMRAAVDRLRSFPLFYTQAGGMARISDRAHALIARNGRPPLDPECSLEFRYVGYVTGEGTLVSGLRQIRAGHALLGEAGEAGPRQVRYYEFRHRDFLNEGDGESTSRLAGVHERVFRRLLDDVGDRQIVIPLSGGYDSRLIGHSLRELGARNVLCYTYGLPGNWESRISRELARYLGFEWLMVPYSAAQWRALAATGSFDRYFMEAGNFASLAHIQDWPAVQALVSEKWIAPDAVFVPGHSGDFLAGSHVPKQFANRQRVSRDEVLQAMFDVHYSLWDWPLEGVEAMRRTFTGRIERVVGPVVDGSAEQAADAFECWDCEERQAKFIVNSVRAYESFGFEWRLPLFDAELMDFWAHVPLDGRLRRRLYFEFVRRHQRLPVTEPNIDRGRLLGTAVRLLDAGGLHRLARRMRRRLRKTAWRRQYEHGDLGWFALVDPNDFRRRYTGRENGHAFFVLKYLERLRAS